jgi:ATP-binding cassette subfamily B multidrug efflux pump
VLMATTGQSAMRDLRRAVFAHVLRLHVGFFDRYPVGRLVTRATNDVENVAEMFSAGIVALVTDLLKMLGFAVALFLVNAKLALCTFVVVPFLAVAAILFRLKVREAFRMVRVRIARINTHIQETITGMKVVQLFTREARNLRDFDAMNASHRDAWKMSIRYDALLFSAVEAAQNITITIIVWYGTGIAEAGVIYVFIDWMRRFFMPLRDLSAKYSVMQSSMASSERIFQLLDTAPVVSEPAQPQRPPRGAGSGRVEFQDVWFAYQDQDWVLRGISFAVEPGEKVALVGATGAGKTTVIKLLTRLYDVTRGRILLDGVDVRELPQAELRRRVATVLQDVVLFSGSVADNIGLGRPDIGRDAIERAARSVQAHRFVEALPQGYDTPVRERASNLSAGQRQLLSFARALAHGADVLVLDEATSSIDRETEAMVQRGIHVLMERQTSIAIAHRLSTIRDVDRIYVLRGGRIVETGSHDELLAAGGLYQRLYRLQVQERPAREGAVERASA